MRKLTLITSMAFAFVLLLTTHVNAQKFAKMDKSPMDATFLRTSKNEPALVRVIYSRPQLKDRALSKLAPNDKIWRTGANEAPNITLYKDMKIGGTLVKAGEYSLFTIPGDTEWTIILSKDINVWGAYSYNKANDVIRVKAKTSTDSESLEAFSIAFDDAGNMYLGWGTVRVAVPFTE